MRRVALHSVLLFVAGVVATTWLASTVCAQRPYSWEYESDANRREFHDFEQFLSAHTWIADKLRKDPSLANNKDFRGDNKELAEFLNAHPFVQSDLKRDARGFMQREQDFERWEREQAAGSGDPNRAALAEFDQFLSNHRWIAGKLKERPGLANDKDFLHDNAELAQFLNAHPFAQARLREDPQGFMRRVENFRTYGDAGNDDVLSGQLTELNQFLANHPWIAKKLRAEPSLANDSGFLDGNKELRDFLNAHPAIQQAFRSNPRAVMNRAF